MSITAWLVSLDLAFAPLILIALALGVALLANREQPDVIDEHWAWIESRTGWKRSVL